MSNEKKNKGKWYKPPKLHRTPYKDIWATRKERWGPAGKDLAVDMFAGLLGALAGASMGRPSLLVGAVVNYAGHFLETKSLSTFGTGMAVVNIISGDPVLPLSGDEEPSKWEKAKARLTAFKKGLGHQLYLDKIFKKDDSTTTTTTTTTDAPVGEIKHFVYPGGDNAGEMDWSDVNAIENQLVNSAKAFQDKQEMKSTDQISGMGIDARAEMLDPLY